jgi:hypothetical protein
VAKRKLLIHVCSRLIQIAVQTTRSHPTCIRLSFRSGLPSFMVLQGIPIIRRTEKSDKLTRSAHPPDILRKQAVTGKSNPTSLTPPPKPRCFAHLPIGSRYRLGELGQYFGSLFGRKSRDHHHHAGLPLLASHSTKRISKREKTYWSPIVTQKKRTPAGFAC